MSLLNVCLVGAGGVIGTMLRYGAGLVATKLGKPGFFATLGVNLVGCFFMGVCIGLGWQRTEEHAYAFAATGILGGLTTYSTLNVQKTTLKGAESSKTIVLYLIATYAGGLLMTAAGVAVSSL